MKRLLLSLVFVLAFAMPSLAAQQHVTLTIGVTTFPHVDIMMVVKKLLAQENITLILREFQDYIQPNTALADKELDANFFQHIPYLEHVNEENNLNFVWVAKVHIEPMGMYSRKIKTLDELRKGDTIAVPDDPTNETRALRFLEKNGLIKLNQAALVTARDITENPRELRFAAFKASQLPHILPDVSAAAINTNFAYEAGLTPSHDAIIVEGTDSSYANVVVVRKPDAHKPAFKALAKACNAPEVREFIVRRLQSSGIFPAF
ncbi:lipoprotein [Deltaproteobacteria bacterium]|nr:lipoprotein [Deltaproteobacteria bacterium]